MIDLQNPAPFLQELSKKLESAEDAPFWKEKLTAATETILSVLQELDRQSLLFTPEGVPVDLFELKHLVAWYDLVSLKTLAFILDESNRQSQLCRTNYSKEMAQNYEPIELDQLAAHLLEYGIELKNERDDFPNRFYIQHYELGEMLKRLMD